MLSQAIKLGNTQKNLKDSSLEKKNHMLPYENLLMPQTLTRAAL